MPLDHLHRRSVLIGMAAFGLAPVAPAIASGTSVLHVRKDPSCGCCGAWIEIMQSAGFEASVQNVSNADLYRFKLESGITPDLASCHTAQIDGYVIEGHVPPSDVCRLLAERPDAIGLSVPGMPYGSPGMGPENERDAYDVLLVKRAGSFEVFTHYPAA